MANKIHSPPSKLYLNQQKLKSERGTITTSNYNQSFSSHFFAQKKQNNTILLQRWLTLMALMTGVKHYCNTVFSSFAINWKELKRNRQSASLKVYVNPYLTLIIV